ncbi:putative aldolase [Gordonia polyisoprenivorans VH2]|uniref:Putative aldolase n=1 Tax=Gordonia polyisoprenivorans (strain DSM 44266 / VH2) TaxID=1112204 RepID=H6N1M8_GORPV|nr:2-amino-3,7-dideoxy-D-threo-hept-6-ulosonate synthase [Gordonia polyisoprenivorans]AFA73347.1 putative aldolase [Gordonia polyisoprenivorans VH2]OZC30453.1 transaldolase [Gordonia polyisoprenivorans]QUD85156.1 transaldolase [Gordonia polyisoprenivorans]
MNTFPDGYRRPHPTGGKAIRLSRIADPVTMRSQIVPMDHSVTVGPLGPTHHTERMVRLLADSGCDAVVLHRGRAQQVSSTAFATMGLIVHLSASTSLGPDQDAKVLVGDVDAALRIGADAVSVHVNVGSATETRQLQDFAAVSRECDALGVPLLAMMYARGPALPAKPAGTTLAHLAAIATDLGADMVKLDYAGSAEVMRAVVDSTPAPIYVAGGPGRTDDEAIEFGAEVLTSGVAGLSFGRNIFDAADPFRVASSLADLVHRRAGTTAMARAGAPADVAALESA